MRFFVTYIAGPFLAFLPERWRRSLPVAAAVWPRAALLSGLLQCVAGIAGLAYWYLRSMTPMISGGADFVLKGQAGTEVSEHQIAGAALVVFATHPLTWLLGFVFVEGALRLLCALIAEEARGSFPLYLFDRAAFLAAHPGEAGAVAREIRFNFAVTFESIRERLLVARLKHLEDDMQTRKVGGEEYLEIRASRRKEGWDPPKIVRVDELYYRLEESSVDKRALERPFRYRLRRLEAGVPGRNVLTYRRGVAADGRNRL
jgi:hypothetical protein